MSNLEEELSKIEIMCNQSQVHIYDGFINSMKKVLPSLEALKKEMAQLKKQDEKCNLEKGQ